MESLEETYRLFLADQEYICNALKNERNLPKDLPALINLVDLLIIKYQHLEKSPVGDVLKIHLKIVDDLLKIENFSNLL
jgi:hypothetical protein